MDQLSTIEKQIVAGIAEQAAAIVADGDPSGCGDGIRIMRYKDAVDGWVKPHPSNWFGYSAESDAMRKRVSRAYKRLAEWELIERVSLYGGPGWGHIRLTDAGKALVATLIGDERNITSAIALSLAGDVQQAPGGTPARTENTDG